MPANPPAATSKRPPSIVSGSMIIAGTAIGAGMLANPTATAGLWFSGSLLLLAYVWFCMCASGLMLLEASLHFPAGASFHTLVSQLLGQKWNIITGIAIAFVLYSLTYAYIFVGGGLTQESVASVFSLELSRPLAASLFLFGLAAIVASSTRLVGYLSTLLITGMLVSFVLASGGLIEQSDLSVLFNQGTNQQPIYWQFLWVALPVCLASFGFHGNVPGLATFYKGQAQPVVRSIIAGSFLAFVIYVLWQLAVQGNLPRAEFAPVIAADGDVSVLLSALSNHIHIAGVQQLLGIFAFMAIISSFIGVTLGLFDYIRDLFHFPNNALGRFKTALITFAPPWLAYLFAPTGFVKVMGYIGLMAAIWAVLVPALLVLKSRQRYPESVYRVFGGKALVYFVILFALLVLAAQLLFLFDQLPVFKGGLS